MTTFPCHPCCCCIYTKGLVRVAWVVLTTLLTFFMNAFFINVLINCLRRPGDFSCTYNCCQIHIAAWVLYSVVPMVLSFVMLCLTLFSFLNVLENTQKGNFWSVIKYSICELRRDDSDVDPDDKVEEDVEGNALTKGNPSSSTSTSSAPSSVTPTNVKARKKIPTDALVLPSTALVTAIRTVIFVVAGVALCVYLPWATVATNKCVFLIQCVPILITLRYVWLLLRTCVHFSNGYTRNKTR